MLVHHYDQITGDYIGSSEADPDPLEKDKFLIPAFATDVALPEKAASEKWVFDAEAKTWSVVHDTKPADENIKSSPSTLFGGPTMKESFSGQQRNY